MRRNPLFLCRSFVVYAALGGLLPLPAFGQNKVITQRLRWLIVPTEHFQIHYTPESQPLVPDAARYLEQAYETVTRDLNIQIPKKVPFFLFANHNQFEENNIADVGEGTGGVTEAFKNRIIVFNDGTQLWLKHVTTHEFVHAVQFEALYGGFWKSARLLKSPLYPLWFMEGMAEYETGETDRTQEDLELRDAATSGRLYQLSHLHGFSHLRPNEVTQAYKQGAAAVRFLSEEYHPAGPGIFLKRMKEDIDVYSIMGEITGQEFASFDKRYMEFMEDYYAAHSEGLEEPEAYGKPITGRHTLPTFNNSPVLSRDGRLMAFITDKEGPREIVLYDFAAQTRRTLAGRQWNLLENIHSEGRALSFSPDGRWLAFAGEKKQRDYLYLYDLKYERLRRVRTPFKEIRSPVFHPRKLRLAVVGMENGLNDLYEITPKGKLIRRLTHSREDEAAPVYSPDGRTLVFSQEMVPEFHEREPERDLLALDLTRLQSGPLTNLPGNETSPVFFPDGEALLFVADEKKVPNLYRLDLASGRVEKRTNVIGGNFSPDIVQGPDSKMVFVSLRRGSRDIYLADPVVWDRAVSTSAVSLPVQPSGRNWAALLEGNGTPEKGLAKTPAQPTPLWTSALFTGSPREYRFHASTDLFFPILFYSTEGGLFAGTFLLWSDYLGNHGLQTALQYASGSDLLDYQAQYQYRGFRPQLIFQSQGQRFYEDFERTEQTSEFAHAVGVSYPLDRFNRWETLVGTIQRRETFRSLPELNFEETENLMAVSFVRDTTINRYLAVTSGHQLLYTYQTARPVFGGDVTYQTNLASYQQFWPTGYESALTWRLMGGSSTGPQPQDFRLGGVDRLRGYSRVGESNRAPRFTLTNLEWRPLLAFTRYQSWFILPDLTVKAIYGVLFTDAAYTWGPFKRSDDEDARRLKNSVGAGIRLPAFILQRFPLTISIDVAKRTDRNQWTWYLYIGPIF